MEKVIIEDENGLKKNIFRILKGTLISIVITIVFLLIFSVILTYTQISEKTIPTTIIAITGVSILIRKFN